MLVLVLKLPSSAVVEDMRGQNMALPLLVPPLVQGQIPKSKKHGVEIKILFFIPRLFALS